MSEKIAVDLRHLRYFVATADAGGITRAAARLNLSQPALSRQVRDLETELGLPLFERRGRRLVLTSQGEDLLARARDLLANASSLQDRARALRSGDQGIIRVGIAPVTLEGLVPPFLTHHQRRHPNVEVRLTEDSPARLWAKVERGELDVAVSFPGHEGLGSRFLFPLCALAVMSEGRFPRRSQLELTDLAQEPLLLLSRQFLTRQWFDEACQHRRFRAKILLESTNPHALIALARVGYGVAVLPSHTPFDKHSLRAVPLVANGLVLGAWAAVTWDHHRFQPPFVEQFIDELVGYARTSYPGKGLIGPKALAASP